MYNFNPRDIPDLAVWIDTQDYSTIVKDGSDLVSSVTNKGNKGAANALQATTLAKPKYITSAINSLPALQFRHDGTNASQLAIADSTALDYSQFSTFIVFQRVTDLGASERLCGKYMTTGNQREHSLYVYNTDVTIAAVSTDGGSGTVLTALDTLPTVVSTPYIMDGGFDGTYFKTSINNRASVRNTQTSVFNGTAPYQIGARETTTLLEPFAGYIGEVLFFTTDLSKDKHDMVKKYLAKKWNISIY